MINERDMMHGVDYLGEDVTSWLMSEKLDGCRAYWDGAVMWSRGGKVIQIPDAMRSALPNIHLDGEMYAGRDGFETARLAVQYGRFTDDVRFVVFDLPGPGSHPFYQRYDKMTWLLPSQGIVSYSEHVECADINAGVKFMNKIQAVNGEGVVLRDPADVYTSGYPSRTRGVLKLKESLA